MYLYRIYQSGLTIIPIIQLTYHAIRSECSQLHVILTFDTIGLSPPILGYSTTLLGTSTLG